MTPTGNTALLLIGAGVGGLLALVWATLVLRWSCDLAEVPAPGFGKALLIVLLVGVIIGLGVFGLLIGLTAVGSVTRWSQGTIAGLVFVLSVGLISILSIPLFVPLLRARFGKAAAVWMWQALMHGIVGAVLLLLLVGGATVVQGVGRLM